MSIRAILVALMCALMFAGEAEARTPEQDLYFAVSENDLAGVTRLLEAGVDPNARPYRERVLNLALRQRRERIAWLLLQRGADPLAANENGDTALAFLSPPETLAQSRIDSGLLALAIYAANRRTICARELSEQTLQGVLERAARLDDLDSARLSPLMRASLCGHANTLRALLVAGASPHLTNSDGDTALSLAAATGATQSLALLLDTPSPPYDSAARLTALLRAAAGQDSAHVGAAEMLLNAGVDVNGADPAGNTALISAARGQNVDMAQLLISRGARLEAANHKGETAQRVARGPMRDALRLPEDG